MPKRKTYFEQVPIEVARRKTIREGQPGKPDQNGEPFPSAKKLAELTAAISAVLAEKNSQPNPLVDESVSNRSIGRFHKPCRSQSVFR